MMLDVKTLFEECIYSQIDFEKLSDIGNLSSSNALLFNNVHFEAENSDNCPRVAILRRVFGVKPTRSVTDFISNQHGRTFEDFIRDLLKIQNISYTEEEQALVEIKDDKGNILLTGRPDKIIEYKNQRYPIEIKTIQSNNSAYKIFIKEKPKLGALLQIAICMYGHNLTKGYILYCASNWFSGFAGRTRWSVEPSFKVFEITQDDEGYFYYNGNKSIVSINKIIQGSYQFLHYKSLNNVPPIPDWIDINGDYGQYNGCNYCKLKEVCESQKQFTLEQFSTEAKLIYERK